jgi:putative NADPH-quinone reductase
MNVLTVFAHPGCSRSATPSSIAAARVSETQWHTNGIVDLCAIGFDPVGQRDPQGWRGDQTCRKSVKG